MRMWTRPSRQRFQSTHPSRGATRQNSPGKGTEAISIHAPLTGCDTGHGSQDGSTEISIHAPLTGCDAPGFPGSRPPLYFNPRTPHGVRRPEHQRSSGTDGFQSTHPSRGATDALPTKLHFLQFQSTHPSRGATGIRPAVLGAFRISIHAPLTGCDGKNCRFEQQFLRLGSREAGSVRPSANQTGTAQKFIFCVPSAVRGGRVFPDRFPFARFRSL